MNYTDSLKFSETELGAQIKVLEEIRQTIKVSNDRYNEFIGENLVPNWTTENGVQSVKRLQRFSQENIQEIINYLDGRINDLYTALQNVIGINKA